MLLYGTNILYKYLVKQNINKKKIPLIATITLNKNTSTWLYEKNKIKNCQRALIKIKIYHFSAKTTQKFLIFLLYALNNAYSINAITLNNPIPKTIDIRTIMTYINNKKNIDNINFTNTGKNFKTCVASAVHLALQRTKKKFINLKAIIIGKTPTVGQQILQELIKFNLTVTICDLNYIKLTKEIKTADLIILAVAVPNILNQQLFKKNSIIIDIGIIINKKNKKIVGNLKINKLKNYLNWYTPVPGGIGPLTTLALIQNIKKTCFKKNHNENKNSNK